MKPLVTIVIPTLNRTTYLGETLKCVLAQDYANLEILISDNGSKDETPVLARQLVDGDPRVRFRRNETTRSIPEHFNQMMAEARGEYYMVVCDDDCITPTFVSEVMGVALRHPTVNAVVPACVTIDERGRTLKTFPRPNGELFNGIEFVSHWLYERDPQYFACLATMLVRTATARRFGGYADFARGQNIDNLLLVQCAITGPVGFAHQAVFSWRIYNNSYGTTTHPKLVGESSRQFTQYLATDPATAQALAALSVTARTEIVEGVRLMSTRAFLYCIKFYDDSVGSFRQLIHFPFDMKFYRMVAGHYWRLLKGVVRTPSSNGDAGVSSPGAPLPLE